jgi:hypothetical protein
MGTNNGSKRSHALADLGNMLLPKLAKEIELDPCEHWVVPVLDSHKEKIRRFGEAQEKNFELQRTDQFLGFCGTQFFPSEICMGKPPTVILVTLGFGISTLGIGAATVGICVACRAAWVAQTLLCMVLAFANSFFAIASLVNSLLTFCNVSAVLFPVGLFPWSAIVSYCAAATTWDSGETVGFVMYWCLKNTVSPICVALVLVMYTQKHR